MVGQNATPQQAATTFGAVVGQVLASRRLALRLSQAQLAETVGATQSVVSRVENGSLPLSVEQLAKFSAALGLRASEVLRMSERSAEVLASQGVQVLYERPQSAREAVSATPSVGPLLGAAAIGALLALAIASAGD